MYICHFILFLLYGVQNRKAQRSSDPNANPGADTFTNPNALTNTDLVTDANAFTNPNSQRSE